MTEDQGNQLIVLLTDLQTLVYYSIASVVFVSAILLVSVFFQGKGSK